MLPPATGVKAPHGLPNPAMIPARLFRTDLRWIEAAGKPPFTMGYLAGRRKHQEREVAVFRGEIASKVGLRESSLTTIILFGMRDYPQPAALRRSLPRLRRAFLCARPGRNRCGAHLACARPVFNDSADQITALNCFHVECPPRTGDPQGVQPTLAAPLACGIHRSGDPRNEGTISRGLTPQKPANRMFSTGRKPRSWPSPAGGKRSLADRRNWC